MLIIGHRGAAGQKPENTLEGIREGHESDVDMIEFDVRLTKDKIPVLIHDKGLWRSHNIPELLKNLTYDELQARTEQSLNPIATLDQVLEEFDDQIMLNLELKDKGSANKILPIVRKYIHKPSEWDYFLFSSFSISELAQVRKASKRAHLGLLQYVNVFKFFYVHHQYGLSAVGFHRLHVNTFVVSAAKKMGLLTYAYTVNRPATVDRMIDLGVDAVVTDYPRKMKKHLDTIN